MIRLWLSLGLLFYLNDVSGQTRVETYLETWIALENQEEALEFIDVYQMYNAIEFSSHDFYNLDKWNQFFFLNLNELDQIRLYLEKYKKETSIAFLNAINGFPKEKAYLIRYKVLEQRTLLKNRGKVKQEFRTYILLPDLDKTYAFKNRTRLQITQKDVQFVLQSEKDLNETSRIDFISGGLKFHQKNNVWFIGDYTPQFGLGLTLFQGYQNALNNQNTNGKDGFKLHTGSDENRFLRGLALESYPFKHHKISAFISSKAVDGKFNSDGITSLFSSGIHVSDSELNAKRSISLQHVGVGYTWFTNKISLKSLVYIAHFDRALNLTNTKTRNQISNAYIFSYFNSNMHLSTELSIDQFKYVSHIALLRLHLGYTFYIRLYSAQEHQSFINPFRRISKSYSTPEQFYGYRLESLKKNIQTYFSYHKAIELEHIYNQKSEYRLGVTFKLKKKSILQLRGTYKQKHEENSLALENNTGFRSRVSFIVNQRGLWIWKQSLLFKSETGYKVGLAYAMQFEYKKDIWKVRLGCALFQQGSGAFYIYEPDILSSGYVRGVFNTGDILYIMTQINLKKASCYSKLRISNQNNESKMGWSFGVKYKF